MHTQEDKIDLSAMADALTSYNQLEQQVKCQANLLLLLLLLVLLLLLLLLLLDQAGSEYSISLWW